MAEIFMIDPGPVLETLPVAAPTMPGHAARHTTRHWPAGVNPAPLAGRWAVALVLLLLIPMLTPALPDDPRLLDEPIAWETFLGLAEQAHAHPDFELHTLGESVEGRPLHAIRLDRSGASSRPWRVLFLGVQHGDEPAGKDALVLLLRDLLREPGSLPEGVDLWLVPFFNPDGAVADQRRNAAGMDLNRDHRLLSQPETRGLHAFVRRIRPDVVVDCHEFGRDTRDYTAQGWTEWPLIMMDTANNPILPESIYELGLEWVDAAKPDMESHGFNYMRYHVGSAPPEGELRWSTLEVDDARNGLALAGGGLSFIIESGIYRQSDTPNADLGERVASYLVLLRRFLTDEALIARSKAAIDSARAQPPPAYLSINHFWGSTGIVVTPVKVVSISTGEVLEIPTPNFMTERIVKRSVPAPRAYAIRADAAPAFQELLAAHGIEAEALASGTVATIEQVRLLRVEGESDPVHNRFAGRAITERLAPAEATLPAGTMIVPLPAANSRRVLSILEPSSLYGLYEEEAYRSLAIDGILPVMRVMHAPR